MTTIIGMIRKALPNATFKRAYGRGQVWWYLLSKKSGKFLSGHRSSVTAINKLKAKFETWEWSHRYGNETLTSYHFIIRDDKGHVLGAAHMSQYPPGEGGCVFFDECHLDDKSLPAYHDWYKKNKKATYKRVS